MATGDIEQKLDTMVDLLKYLLAVELARCGVPQTQIAKRVRLATATVNKVVQGVKLKRNVASD
jgi:DNA-binding NarL/FixJ family response regulator